MSALPATYEGPSFVFAHERSSQKKDLLHHYLVIVGMPWGVMANLEPSFLTRFLAGLPFQPSISVTISTGSGIWDELGWMFEPRFLVF